MSDDVKRAKGERTFARRTFNSLLKRIKDAIIDDPPKELLNSMMEELRNARKDLINKHKEYLLISSEDEPDEAIKADTYLDGPQNDFYLAEQSVFEYLQKIADRTKQDGIRAEEVIQQAKADASKSEQAKLLSSLHNVRSVELAVLETEFERATSLKDRNVGNSTVDEIESEIKGQFKKVKDANMKIIQAKGESAETEINWLVDIHRQYQTAIGIITQLKDNNSEKTTSSSIVSKNKRSNLQLQKIPMPSFTGNIRDYPRFKSDLEKYVLPTIENADASAYVLASSLQGEALQLVKNLSDDITAMWRRLDEVYGNHAKVVDIIMNEIKRLAPVAENDHCSLIALINVIESGYMDLTRLGIEQEISNSQTVSVVEEKLPRDVKLAWSKKVIKNGSTIHLENKFSKLLEFLQGQRRLIEYANADIRLPERVDTESTHHVNHTDFGCLIHATNNHSTQNCRAYIAMDAKGKVDLLNSHKACYTCLKPSHFAKDCRLTDKCGKGGCVKTHHETLHEAHTQGLVFTMANENVSESCLLQLMKVNCAKNQSAQLTVLWDSGAQLCLITFRKAQELNLKGRPTQLSH